MNRSIFNQELYHTSQKISQHDCPIKIFSHKHKYMYKEQSLCKLVSQNVINMSLLKALVLSVVLVYFRWHESVSKCHTCTKKVRRRIKPVFRKWRSGKWRPIGGSRDLGWVGRPHLEVPGPWVFLLFKRRILMLALFYFSKIDPSADGSLVVVSAQILRDNIFFSVHCCCIVTSYICENWQPPNTLTLSKECTWWFGHGRDQIQGTCWWKKAPAKQKFIEFN